MDFKLHSKFKMTGDQPEAVEKLVNSIKSGNKFDAKRSYGFRKNFHDGKYNRKDSAADARNCSQ